MLFVILSKHQFFHTYSQQRKAVEFQSLEAGGGIATPPLSAAMRRVHGRVPGTLGKLVSHLSLICFDFSPFVSKLFLICLPLVSKVITCYPFASHLCLSSCSNVFFICLRVLFPLFATFFTCVLLVSSLAVCHLSSRGFHSCLFV